MLSLNVTDLTNNSHANSIKHAHHTNQAWHVHVSLDVNLGCRIRLHGLGTELWWTGSLSILPGNNGGALLPRCNLHAVYLLYTEGSRYAHCTALLRADPGNRILGLDRSWCLCGYGRSQGYRWMALAVYRVGPSIECTQERLQTDSGIAKEQ